jgi:hypothetical protein
MWFKKTKCVIKINHGFSGTSEEKYDTKECYVVYKNIFCVCYIVERVCSVSILSDYELDERGSITKRGK